MPEETTATTAPLAPQVLKEESDDRLIQLSAFHCTSPLTVKQTVARFWCGGANIIRMSDDHKPKQFHIPTAEMEALVAGWTQYKADLQAAKEEEGRRQAAVIAEAYELARQYSEIKIKEHTNDDSVIECWEVTLHATATRFRNPANTADGLLAQVQTAVKHWQEHLKTQAEFAAEKERDTAMITHAQMIADGCEAIMIKKEAASTWLITLFRPHGKPEQTYAHTATQLLDVVKNAKRVHDQWQQEAPAEPLQG